MLCFFFFFKQKTAYEMRISDWSSDVCSSDLQGLLFWSAPAGTLAGDHGLPSDNAQPQDVRAEDVQENHGPCGPQPSREAGESGGDGGGSFEMLQGARGDGRSDRHGARVCRAQPGGTRGQAGQVRGRGERQAWRSEEHTSELQSLMRT